MPSILADLITVCDSACPEWYITFTCTEPSHLCWIQHHMRYYPYVVDKHNTIDALGHVILILTCEWMIASSITPTALQHGAAR